VRREGGFVGAAAALRQPARGLRCLALADPRAVALGGEPVRIGGPDGGVVGQVTSGGYGYTVARSIAYTYLPVSAGDAPAGAVAVDGDWIPAEVAPQALYDPKGERIRA
jgi:4-methylaminobutanoate oxidase (formaldehyde-forming)